MQPTAQSAVRPERNHGLGRPIIPPIWRLATSDGALCLAAFTGGLAWTLWLFAGSPGTPSQDEISHYMISRDAWRDPHLILDAWGRPANTLLYLLPSRFGLTGARISAVAFAAITVVLASLIARSLGVQRLYLVPLFLWFQPWYHDYGYLALTEIPFSMVLAFAIYSWLRERPRLAALAIGVLPLMRWEALALLPLAGLLLIVFKRWRSIPYLVAPMALYLVFFALAAGDAISLWEYIGITPGLYGYGGWTHFFGTSARAIGSPILLLSAVGLSKAARSKAAMMVTGVYVVYFALQVFSWRFGRGAGYLEFVLPIAPGVAILAAIGAERLLELISQLRLTPRTLATMRAAVIVIAAVAVLGLAFQTEPRALDKMALAMKDAALWVQNSGPEPPVLLSTHVWFQYFYGLPFPRRFPGLVNGGRDLRPGSIMVWDRQYSDRWNYPLEVLENPANGWKRLVTFRGNRAVIFVKL